jgi:DNA-binding LacI/PurR family transcriptional regulator
MTTGNGRGASRPVLRPAQHRSGARPTIEDVASLAGVSRGTVSRVLNGGLHVRPQVVEAVNRAVQALDYSVNQAARNLAGGRTGSVAFVISEQQDHLFQDPNYVLFTRTFGRELRAAGRHLLVTTAQDREEEASIGDYLSAGHVDGVLLGLPHLDEPLLARLLHSQVPVVVVGRPMEYEDDLSWVAVDDEEAAYEVVAYLAGKGRSTIATVTGPLNTSGGQARLVGYRRALRDSYRESLVAEGDWSLQSGRTRTEELLARHPDVDALFAASDLMALGAMGALRQAGLKVPEDVAVAGFDDSEVALTAEPPLTTVHHPLEEIAMEALRILDDLIEGRVTKPRHVLFPTTFVARASA